MASVREFRAMNSENEIKDIVSNHSKLLTGSVCMHPSCMYLCAYYLLCLCQCEYLLVESEEVWGSRLSCVE